MNQAQYVAAVVEQLARPTEAQAKQLLPLLNEDGNGLAAAVVAFPIGPAKVGRAAGLSVELVGRPFLVDGMYRRQTKYPVDLHITLQPVSNHGDEDTHQQVWGQPFELTTYEKMAIVSAIVELALFRVGVVSVMHSLDEVTYQNEDGTYSHTERAVHLMFGVSVCRAGVILTKAVTVGRRLLPDGKLDWGFGIVEAGSTDMVLEEVVIGEVVTRLQDAFSGTVLGMCIRNRLADILRAELPRRLHAEVAEMAHADTDQKGFRASQTQKIKNAWSKVFGRWPAIILEVTHRPKEAAPRIRRELELE